MWSPLPDSVTTGTLLSQSLPLKGDDIHKCNIPRSFNKVTILSSVIMGTFATGKDV